MNEVRFTPQLEARKPKDRFRPPLKVGHVYLTLMVSLLSN